MFLTCGSCYLAFLKLAQYHFKVFASLLEFLVLVCFFVWQGKNLGDDCSRKSSMWSGQIAHQLPRTQSNRGVSTWAQEHTSIQFSGANPTQFNGPSAGNLSGRLPLSYSAKLGITVENRYEPAPSEQKWNYCSTGGDLWSVKLCFKFRVTALLSCWASLAWLILQISGG